MKVQFIRGNYNEIVEFDVAAVPTTEEMNLIYADIYHEIDKYEEEYGDLEDFDFWQCCYCATNRHVGVLNNPVVKTFYI